MAGKGPLRVKRPAYRGATSSPPRWHRPAGNYDPKEVYLRIETLCGYELDGLRPVSWSTAVKPRGELCSKCEAKVGELTDRKED